MLNPNALKIVAYPAFQATHNQNAPDVILNQTTAQQLGMSLAQLQKSAHELINAGGATHNASANTIRVRGGNTTTQVPGRVIVDNAGNPVGVENPIAVDNAGNPINSSTPLGGLNEPRINVPAPPYLNPNTNPFPNANPYPYPPNPWRGPYRR